MHVGVLNPKYLSPFGNIKKKRRGIPNKLKAEEVVVETQNGGKPSSPRADSLGSSQDAQSSVGDDQMQFAANPCDPPYTQISTANTQTEK